jgi:hypothetical protein
MYSQKFQLTFKDGCVNLDIRFKKGCFWVYWIDSSPTKKGLSTQALKLLNSYGYKPLKAYKAIHPALKFWDKKLKQKLITDMTLCNCLKCQRQARESLI